jgi:hypothetical protein
VSDALIGFLGVLVGASLTMVRDAVAHWFNRRRRAHYAAVRIICALDQFVEASVEVVDDDGTCHGRPAGRTDQGEEYHQAQVALLDPPQYPDDIDWTSINPALMHRCLALPNSVSKTNRIIHYEAEHSSPPDYIEIFDARQLGYIALGSEAQSIADALSAKFGLRTPQVALRFAEWNPREYFAERKAKIEKRQIALQKSDAEMNKVLGLDDA